MPKIDIRFYNICLNINKAIISFIAEFITNYNILSSFYWQNTFYNLFKMYIPTIIEKICHEFELKACILYF